MQRTKETDSFQVLTWNVNFRSTSVLDALSNLHTTPEIITLQEISIRHATAFQERLAELGLQYSFYSGRADSTEKRYGNLISSRWPIESTDFSSLKTALPWPQLVAQVVIRINGSPINIITAHIPNGSGNGWAKIDTFRSLTEAILLLKGNPCILTGDFNEPQFALQDGRIVTFGQEINSDGCYSFWKHWSFKGRTGTGEEWDAAVRWFFEGREEHSLRHAFWEVSSYGKMEPTHISHGKPRWFDHLFISKDFEVESCAYIHDARLKGFSDHSALVAQIASRS
jgi:endonuclease/exonuclease/phosphatase family metal-dependent hydrolase